MIDFVLSSGITRHVLNADTPKSGLKIRSTKENEQRFVRHKLTGSVTVSGADYGFVRENLNTCCSELLFSVESGGNTLIRAIVDPYGIEFNDSQCKATINTFTAKDPYTAIVANWEKPVNVLADVSKLVTFNTKAGKPQQRRGRWLMDILHYLLTETLKGTAGINVVRVSSAGYSEFFDAPTNPVTNAANPERRAALVHLSDARLPNATEPAKTATMTLKGFLAELRALYNVYWDVNSSGYFRLEHRQFYDMGGRYAIRPVDQLTDIRPLGIPKTYTYLRTNQYGGEYLELSQNESLLENGGAFLNVDPSPFFYRAGVRYETCVAVNAAGETETNTFSSTWITHYDAILETPSDAGRSGWVLVHLTPTVISSTWNLFTDANGGLNTGLMASALFSNYHDWGRSFVSGKYFELGSANVPGQLRMNRFTEPGRLWGPLTLNVCDADGLAPLSGPVRFAGDADGYAFIEESEWDFVKGIQTITVKSAGLCSSGPLAFGASTGTGCLPAGTLLRTVVQPPRQNSGSNCTKVEYYADGNCGEYPVLKAC